MVVFCVFELFLEMTGKMIITKSFLCYASDTVFAECKNQIIALEKITHHAQASISNKNFNVRKIILELIKI